MRAVGTFEPTNVEVMAMGEFRTAQPVHDQAQDGSSTTSESTLRLGRLLTSAEVAEIIRVPQATLRYWRHIGIGPRSFKMGPRRVLYRENDVVAWVDQQIAAGA
jgi:predicted DNA-binding transcriptional regulator AlpA